MRRVDLNADVGEGMGGDEQLFRHITSANIACGAHAGSVETIRASVRLAVAHRVAIGAHPGLADPEHFGRRAQVLTGDEARALVAQQVSLVQEIAADEGGRMTHVKPHGALYNMAARDAALAEVIAQTIRAIDPALILVGLSGSELIRAGSRVGLLTANEVFADRRYHADGSLVSRARPDAVIDDVAEAVKQVVSLVAREKAPAIDGPDVSMQADTICLHGDRADAARLARDLCAALAVMGVEIAPLRRPGARA